MTKSGEEKNKQDEYQEPIFISESIGKWVFTVISGLTWIGTLLIPFADGSPSILLSLAGNALISGFTWWRFWSGRY